MSARRSCSIRRWGLPGVMLAALLVVAGCGTARAPVEAGSTRWSSVYLIERRQAAIVALAAEQRALAARGDEAAAETKRAEVHAALATSTALSHQHRAKAKQREDDFRLRLRGELAEAVAAEARARGLGLVLDRAYRARPREPLVVFVSEGLSPADDGGLREGPTSPAIVRTIDLEGLYARHPRVRELAAMQRAEEQADEAEAASSDAPEALARALASSAGAHKASPGAAGEEEARRKRLALARGVQELNRDLRRSSRAIVGEQERRALRAEIEAIVGRLVARAGVQLVLDASDQEPPGLPRVAYADPKIDVTAEVARELGIPQKR